MKCLRFPYLLLLTAIVAAAAVSCRKDNSADYNTEALVFYGDYNGAIGNSGECNYYICLSDIGFGDDGSLLPGGRYYYFDVFSTAAADLKHITLQEGTYSLGPWGETAVGTFTPNYSLFEEASRYGGTLQLTFTSGILTVSRNGSNYTFEAELTDVAGMTHHVHYSGPTAFTDYSTGVTDYLPLEQTISIQAKAAMGSVNDDMEGLGDGISNVILSFTDMNTDADGYTIPPGSILNIDCYMRLTEDGRLPGGHYHVTPEWGPDSTLSPGEVNLDQIYGTVVEYYDAQGSAYLGLITEGSLHIINSAELSYNITFAFTTNLDYEVAGNYYGPLDLLPYQNTSVSKAPAAGKRLHRPVSCPTTRSHFSVKTL